MLKIQENYWRIFLYSSTCLLLNSCANAVVITESEDIVQQKSLEQWRSMNTATYDVDVQTSYSTAHLRLNLQIEGECQISPVATQFICETQNVIDGVANSTPVRIKGNSEAYYSEDNELWFRWNDVIVEPSSFTKDFPQVFDVLWQIVPWKQTDESLANFTELLPISNQKLSLTRFEYNEQSEEYNFVFIKNVADIPTVFWVQNPTDVTATIHINRKTYVPKYIEWKVVSTDATLGEQQTVLRLTNTSIGNLPIVLPNPSK